MTKEQLKQRITEILRGIDECETETRYGWWETSFQAEFGAGKLADVLAAVDELEVPE